jgi:thymidine phosphorylase
MKTLPQAQLLAASMESTGRALGLRVSTVLCDMNQPLGRACGNALEVREAQAILAGGGPVDVAELVIELGGRLLCDAGRAASRAHAAALLREQLASGAARRRFDRMVAAQGGDPTCPLPLAPSREILAPHGGTVTAIDTAQLGQAIVLVGGGRRAVGQTIDHGVGLEMLVRLGDRVDAGQPLVRLFARDNGPAEASRAETEQRISSAVTVVP